MMDCICHAPNLDDIGNREMFSFGVKYEFGIGLRETN